MPRDRPNAVFLEGLHPSVEHTNPDFPTGALYLGARVRLGSEVSVVAEVPYARFGGTYYEDYGYYYGYGGYLYDEESATFGNPYLGLEIQKEGSIFFLEMGARAPLADRAEPVAINAGTVSDLGRFDAFTPDAVPIHIIANIREVTPSGLAFRFRLGPMMVTPTQDRRYFDNLFYALFAWQVGYEGKEIRVGTAISGTSLLNEDNGNLGQRTTTSFEAHADFGSWKIRPGADLKIPIGSPARLVPLVLGASIGASW